VSSGYGVFFEAQGEANKEKITCETVEALAVQFKKLINGSGQICAITKRCGDLKYLDIKEYHSISK
jgi:hypothetical protein